MKHQSGLISRKKLTLIKRPILLLWEKFRQKENAKIYNAERSRSSATIVLIMSG